MEDEGRENCAADKAGKKRSQQSQRCKNVELTSARLALDGNN